MQSLRAVLCSVGGLLGGTAGVIGCGLARSGVRAEQARRSARAWTCAQLWRAQFKRRFFGDFLVVKQESYPPAGAGPGALQQAGEADAKRFLQRIPSASPNVSKAPKAVSDP